MKMERKIIFTSFAMGLFIWLAEALLDFLIFHEETFTESLITRVPLHDLFIRSLILLSFLIFGFICARLISKQKETEHKMSTSLSFQQQLLDTIPVPIFYKDEKYIYRGTAVS